MSQQLPTDYLFFRICGLVPIFLTEEQIWGDKALQVIKNYGTKTGMSDLAVVLGGYMESDTTSDNQRSGYIWSASSDGGGYVRNVRGGGDRYFYGPYGRLLAARPALPSSLTSIIQASEASLSLKNGNTVQIAKYGEYPQEIAKPDAAKELNGLSANALKRIKTGKKYTFDDEKFDAYDKPFKPKEYDEYQHNGKRYIRVEARPYDSDSVLSNGRKPQAGEACWIEVQPIEWLKDPSGMMVARQALFAGVQFDRNQRYDGNFANTDMKQYLDTCFFKDIFKIEEEII